jgi:hypothetical protein
MKNRNSRIDRKEYCSEGRTLDDLRDVGTFSIESRMCLLDIYEATIDTGDKVLYVRFKNPYDDWGTTISPDDSSRFNKYLFHGTFHIHGDERVFTDYFGGFGGSPFSIPCYECGEVLHLESLDELGRSDDLEGSDYLERLNELVTEPK